MGVLSLAVLTVACAGTPERDSAATYDTHQASRLFAIGYHDIADIYIKDVQISELALAGMNGLESLDPNLHVARHDSHIEVTVGGEGAGSFEVPSEDQNAEAWGSLTASVLNASVRSSEELNHSNVESLYERVFDSLLERLDPYSRYAGAERARDNRASRDGYGGLGIIVEATPAGIRILDVRPDGPAATAGLESDDLILRVDGDMTQGLEQHEAVNLLRGQVDTPVELLVQRPGLHTQLDVSTQRAHIVPKTVTYRREDDTAYIKLSGFNQNTAASLEEAVVEAQRDIGGSLKGYILDLRGNPGGLLDQAVDVADLFVTQGRIVSTHGRHPDSHQYFSAKRDDYADGRPIIVLVDRNSASAAEIVAAAIQDSGRGLLVGSGSYGKGTVQTVLRLPNQGELTLTWARFHAPSGYTLSQRGVLPDVCTSLGIGGADAITAAIRSGRQPTDINLRQRSLDPSDFQGLADLRAHCPPRHGNDTVDMEMARRLLHDTDLFRLAGGNRPAAALAKIEQ